VPSHHGRRYDLSRLSPVNRTIRCSRDGLSGLQDLKDYQDSSCESCESCNPVSGLMKGGAFDSIK
jgi:hypothetical protein